MDNERHDRDADDPGVVNLQSEQAVDWLAEGRRDMVVEYDCGDRVSTPNGDGTIVARFVMDREYEGWEITAAPESPTYLVQHGSTEDLRATYNEAEINPVEDEGGSEDTSGQGK